MPNEFCQKLGEKGEFQHNLCKNLHKICKNWQFANDWQSIIGNWLLRTRRLLQYALCLKLYFIAVGSVR